MCPPPPADPQKIVWTKPYFHLLTRMCNYYGVFNAEIRCYLYFSRQESGKILKLVKNLDKNFIAIEPYSNPLVRPNRAYSFAKWQKVVDALKESIQIVQLGASGSPVLKNVVDLTGQTSFKVAAGVAGKAKLFLSVDNGLTHAVTGTDTIGLIILTSYQPYAHIAYPRNINIYIGKHGPCGSRGRCFLCEAEVDNHDETEIIRAASEYLNL